MKVENQTCYAYFRGSDGLGTCDTECQWYKGMKEGSMEPVICPWWKP